MIIFTVLCREFNLQITFYGIIWEISILWFQEITKYALYDSNEIFSHQFQEEVLTQDDTFLQPATNELGMLALPIINGEANALNSFEYSDKLMQSGINMYPGEEWCNLVIPHAKWHLETGIALTDFTFLSDELYRILDTYYSYY